MRTTGHVRGNAYRGAFSLLELLVVVAILSLLMAVLLPALGQAKRIARRIACRGNLKHIALAYFQYLDANNGTFYGSDDPNVPNPCDTFGGWTGIEQAVLLRPVNGALGLSRYNPSEAEAKVFRCPADRSWDPSETINGSVYRDLGNSYKANGMLVAWYAIPTRGVPPNCATINERIRDCGRATRDAVYQPSRLLWMADYRWMRQWDPMMKQCTGWHGRRHHHCAVFLDGHSEFVDLRKGLYDVDGGYRIQPHKAADGTVREFQQRAPCSCELEQENEEEP